MRISDWSSDVCSSDLSIATAAAFIKANMPLSQGDTLTDQQAWDVAYFIDAHERPQDPRFNGSLEETRQKFHGRSEEHTSELQSLMRISYAVFCLKKKTKQTHNKRRTKQDNKTKPYTHVPQRRNKISELGH